MSRQTYLLVGISGSGKSTTGNAILNKSGEIVKLENPFMTSDSASGCTMQFETKEKEDLNVIDTVGFNDPKFNLDSVLKQLRESLKLVNNKVNAVIYVVKCGKFTNEIIEFFKIVQEKALESRCKSNSILIVTKSKKGWVSKQSSNEFVQKALSNCNGQYFEFDLAFDDPDDDDDEDDRKRNAEKRQKSVDRLHEFLRNKQFKEIDLSFIQKAEYNWDSVKSALGAIGAVAGVAGVVGAVALIAIKALAKK